MSGLGPPAAGAPTSAPDALNDRLRAELEESITAEIRRMVLSNRIAFPVGSMLFGLVLVFVLWPTVSHPSLLFWLGCVATSSLCFVGALLWPGERLLDRTGMPLLFRASGYVVGVVWGLLPWIDLRALDSSWAARGLGLVGLLGIVIAAHSPTLAGTRHAMRAELPMVALTMAAYLAIGYYPVVFGLILLLAIVVPDAERSRRFVLAGVEARMAAAQAAVRDPLTGLANRTAVLAALTERSATAAAGDATTVLYIDLDRFKQVNDRLGHGAGDDLLREAASRLQACFRPQDVVSRIGGDEFVVVLAPELPEDPRDELDLARRVITSLEQPFLIADRSAVVSASVGVARLPAVTAAKELLASADRALYRAKRDGRRRVVQYDHRFGADLDARGTLEVALRAALSDGEIEPYAQPVFDLRTGEVISVELLARWAGADGRPVSPADFIPLAEEVGLIRDLGVQMLGHAVGALRSWQQVPELARASIAVNISPLHVVDGLLDDVTTALAGSPTRAVSLTLEITEQQALPDEDGTREVLDAVNALGVRVAIDDFGAGFSSIRWLTSLPVQLVKLDRSLLAAVLSTDDAPGAVEAGAVPRPRPPMDAADPNGSGLAVLRSVNQLAEAMGRTAVAEGIETQTELATVREAGITLGQGYLLCRPMPLAEFTAMADAVCARAAAAIRVDGPMTPHRMASSSE